MIDLFSFLIAMIIGITAGVVNGFLISRKDREERRSLHTCPFCGSWLMIEAKRV